MWNVESKRLVWYEQLTFPYIVLLQYKNIFKILARLFVLFMLRKKGQQHNLSFDKRPTQSINVKYDEKLTSAQDRVNYSRNTSFSCYKTLKESNGRLNERVAINRILAFAQRVLGSPRGKRVSTKRRPKTKDRRLKTEDRRPKNEDPNFFARIRHGQLKNQAKAFLSANRCENNGDLRFVEKTPWIYKTKTLTKTLC